MRSVAKHSYVKGKNAGARVAAHIDYIAHRPGADREERGGRSFFNDEEVNRSARQVKQEFAKDNERVPTHKIIFSPGVQGVDLKTYTREILDELGREKGVDFKWSAVEHRNTDHDHVHAVIAGLDKNGRQVRFDRDDYKTMRDVADRYIERNHQYDRFLDRELSDLLRDRSGYSREGDREFQALIGDITKSDRSERVDDSRKESATATTSLDDWSDSRDSKTRHKDGTTEREFFKFDSDLARSLQNTEIHRSFGRKQWTRETQGRMQHHHAEYQMKHATAYWTEMMRGVPNSAVKAQDQLSYLEELRNENQRDNRNPNPWRELDGLLGDQYGREYKEKKTDRQEHQHTKAQDEQQRPDREKPRDHVRDHTQTEDATRGQAMDNSAEGKKQRNSDDEERGRGDRGDR